MARSEGSDSNGFTLVLKELLSLHGHNNSQNEEPRLGFDLVLQELMAEREKAAVATALLKQQNELMAEREKAAVATVSLKQQEETARLMAKQQNEMMLRLQKQQEEFQARQDQLLAKQDKERLVAQKQRDKERLEAQKRQDMYVAKIFEVVNQQKEELSFFRTGGSDKSNFDLPDKQILAQRKQQQQRKSMTRSKADISEFDSLQEIEADQNESADLEVSEFILSTSPEVSEYEINDLLGAKIDKGENEVENAEEELDVLRNKDRRMKRGPPMLRQEEVESTKEEKPPTPTTVLSEPVKAKMRAIAEEIYKPRTNKVETNLFIIREVMSRYPDDLAPLLKLCPKFDIILAHMLVFRLGVRVQEVDWTSDMKDWNEEDCRRVGRSMATVMRMVQTGLAAAEAWKKRYVQLGVLFDEVEGFEDFILEIANNSLRDNKFGMIFRVGIGAALSVIDAGTDVYVVSTYYESEELYMKANLLLAMILSNLFVEIMLVLGVYQQKNWRVKLSESLICLLFLRPVVDAYRVSSGHSDIDKIDGLLELVINKCIELGCESIPGCILQLYVWMLNPGEAGVYALASIGISSLTTGFASAMIAFDMDVDVPHREAQPRFYGYIPDENGSRMKCFTLMTMMSALHNLSRSLGCALLAASNGGVMWVVYLSGGEMLLFFVLKVLRGDFYYWPRFEGPVAKIVSLLGRFVMKVIVDYSGCLHLRHPYEMGGLMFSLSMLWAQVFPFIALYLVDDNGSNLGGRTRREMLSFLIGIFILWLVLTITFFCTIDISYIGTFFGTKAGPQYTVELFESGNTDHAKFNAIFTNRLQYTEKIHGKVNGWVAKNLDRWRRDKPEWFKIELIPDKFLPKEIFEEEGGARRKRSSVSIFRQDPPVKGGDLKVDPTRKSKVLPHSDGASSAGQWRELAEDLYEVRTNNYKSNFIQVKRIFAEKEELVRELMELCPKFREIISHILEDKFGWRVQKVDWTSEMSDWGLEECRRVGCSLATFIRKRKTGEHAIDAWRLHYVQLDVLFKEVEGFGDFMLAIANRTLRDSIYGMVYRVSVGALLSMIDAATDIYVISTYYQSVELYGQANAMLAMLLVNASLQLLSVYSQYKRKSWSVIGKEALITLLFLRPAVDAYRVATNHEDDEATFDSLAEMVLNKCCELAGESIPGAILQLYVWLLAPEKAGTYALVSIGISCLTTGFASAMIAFDMDVDVPHRKAQPKFYGYIPDQHGPRGRCFILMTSISAFHNLSRSLGCALLAASDTDNLVLIFVGGEIGLYLVYKILRDDFHYWIRLDGKIAIFGSLFSRIVTKVIADFSGCLHLRHPYELGGFGFTLSLVWAQILPFVALFFFSGKDEGGNVKDIMTGFLAICFIAWLVLNITFFCTIDLSYLNTFVGTKTAPQYTCELFLTSQEDHQRFRAVFKNRIEYTKSIHGKVKEWVEDNIDEWRRDQPDWFKIEMIPDEFLSKNLIEAVGGAKRRRSIVSMREMVGLREASVGRVHPQAVEEMNVEDM